VDSGNQETRSTQTCMRIKTIRCTLSST